MRSIKRIGLLGVATSALFVYLAGSAQAQILLDPGFENYDVSSGSFLRPSSGPWQFANDAGVVRPFAPNSSLGPLDTWSATFAAPEGAQYASTYASLDSLRQTVSFAAAGTYRISVLAAAPEGLLTIPTVGTFTLTDGEFTFIFNNSAVGLPQTVAAGSSWNSYFADFTVTTPGEYQVGVRNSRASPYFINYDSFVLEPVPEPAALQLFVVFGMVAICVRSRRIAVTRG